MFIITRASPLENCKDNNYRVQDVDFEKQYLDAGYHRYDRNYKIKEQYQEYTVICPEYRNGARGLEPIVITPDFIVPGRPYPVYVYLYGIGLYSGNPGKGQRWAAAETRKKFGLETFAHTTLGRALKALASTLSRAGMATDNGDPETTNGDKAVLPKFPSVQGTGALRKQAARFLSGRLAQAELNQMAPACCRLAREWFLEHQRFLL